jgi:hypothetical protein
VPLTPPLDADGSVKPHDDPAILADTFIIRHINPDYHVCFDENLGSDRIGGNAFSATNRDPHYGMSVDIGQLLAEAGLPECHIVPPGMGAVRLPVGSVRALSLKLGSDPIVPSNQYHGQVWGVKNSKRKKLQQIVVGWVVELPGVALR